MERSNVAGCGALGEATATSGISRRRFLVRSTAVAAGTGALVWAAPAIRTVQTGAAAGSGAPSPNAEGTVAPTTAPEQATGVVNPAPTAPTSGPPVAVAPDGASLPLTGGDIAQLTTIGATSVVAGGLILRAQQRTQDEPLR